jgi:hypothetical protein
MRPVLLLYMRVVILLIGARARELHLPASRALVTEREQVVVDELAAVIGVQAPQDEGQLLLKGRHGLHDFVATLTPDRLPVGRQACRSTQVV